MTCEPLLATAPISGEMLTEVATLLACQASVNMVGKPPLTMTALPPFPVNERIRG